MKKQIGVHAHAGQTYCMYIELRSMKVMEISRIKDSLS